MLEQFADMLSEQLYQSAGFREELNRLVESQILTPNSIQALQHIEWTKPLEQQQLTTHTEIGQFSDMYFDFWESIKILLDVKVPPGYIYHVITTELKEKQKAFLHTRVQ
jgi:hypothetical protein